MARLLHEYVSPVDYGRHEDVVHNALGHGQGHGHVVKRELLPGVRPVDLLERELGVTVELVPHHVEAFINVGPGALDDAKVKGSRAV